MLEQADDLVIGGIDLVADFSRYIVCPREVDLIALRSANILAQAIDRAFL